MIALIEKIEKGICVVIEADAGARKKVPASDIKGTISVGAVLIEDRTGYSVDEEATNERKGMIRDRFRRLKEKK